MKSFLLEGLRNRLNAGWFRLTSARILGVKRTEKMGEYKAIYYYYNEKYYLMKVKKV